MVRSSYISLALCKQITFAKFSLAFPYVQNRNGIGSIFGSFSHWTVANLNGTGQIAYNSKLEKMSSLN